jgi:glycolate oxidase iron-sulfur subunit
VTVKDYGHALAHDPDYADEGAPRQRADTRHERTAARPGAGALKPKLRKRALRAGWPSTRRARCSTASSCAAASKAPGRAGLRGQLATSESHLCCGSAGTYSVLQPELATQLRDRKLAQLTPIEAQVIVSANIGCIQHLQGGTTTPVRHWVEALDDALA